ncbi:glycosyltransferase [Paraburkholderia sp. WS6]|nr:glycosyltransferase [Paraburkholderia sp. WS6]MDQ6411094.1 glycosyltransferase [Paraburkholderia madseniana]
MSELPEICDHVYNGIDLSRKFEFQRKKSSGGIRLGFLGRISPEKGLEFLLLALKKLTIPVRLLVGGGIDSATAKKMRSIASNVNIDFMGYVKPETIFQEVDYLVVPSLWNEPFSRVIIEAYAYGVPVVASDRGGIGEIVRDGETGYIFDPESIDSAVSAIWKAFKALGNWQDLSKNSSEYSKQFDLNVATGSYLKIYDEVIGRRRRLHSPGSLVTP